MLSAKEIEEIKRHNEKIDRARHILFRVFEILTGVFVLGAAFYPKYPGCVVLLICSVATAVLSNQFCDD